MKKLGMQTKGRDVKSSESRNMKFDIIKGHLYVKCNTAAMTVAVAEAGLAGFEGLAGRRAPRSRRHT